FDSFNRRHDYLRISLTERCNLRCFYCMPSEGVELSPSTNILSDDEIIRLAALFVKNGVTKIRLTGGEPTVRKSIVELVGRLSELRKFGLKSIAMTSNGLALHRKLPKLVENGLTHLNLSLDTLDPLKFEIMTRRPGHEAVLRSLDLALKSTALQSVKLNAVVIRGLNDSEVPQFLELTKENLLSVRFIEFMPFSGNKWDKRKMISSSELLSSVSAIYPGVFKVSDEVNDTARSYKVPGYRGSFGFISSMSDHFCGSCNRLRLTADGQIKVCLFDSKEVSLKDLMRRGASNEELLRVIRGALGLKKEKHAGMDDIDIVNNRPMILIGDEPHQMFVRVKNPAFQTPLSFDRRKKTRLSGTRHASTVSFSTSVSTQQRLTHLDDQGRPAMVDVSGKEITQRSATAQGRIYIPEIAYNLVRNPSKSTIADTDTAVRRERSRAKGDVLTVAQLAGIMASKRTSDLIPLCHPIPLSHVSVELSLESRLSAIENEKNDKTYSIICRATTTCDDKTGVEMEALAAVSVSLLTVWDMLKAVAGKEMIIDEICVMKKSGGKNGDFVRCLDEEEASR
ncbi:molybdenum cofactor biosynthesis prote, partial [Phellopilus nigrolimitatus]